MLRSLALEHLSRALGAAILHPRREVAISAPTTHKRLDIHLMKARRVECDPDGLLEALGAEGGAEVRLCKILDLDLSNS